MTQLDESPLGRVRYLARLTNKQIEIETEIPLIAICRGLSKLRGGKDQFHIRGFDVLLKQTDFIENDVGLVKLRDIERYGCHKRGAHATLQH